MEEWVIQCETIDVLRLKALKKTRLLFFQELEPEEAWEEIRQNYNVLAKEELFSCNLPHKSKSSEIRQLAELQNARALIAYCDWMDEELDATFRTFLPDQIDEYQLEAKIKDFRHEMENPLLLDAKREEQEVLGLEESVINEKRLLHTRLVMRGSLQTAVHALGTVVEGVGKIEAIHPELLPTKWKALTLQTIIEELPNWDLATATLWTQFLNAQLGVFACVGGPWTCALREAMAKLFTRFSAGDILDMLQNWESSLLEANRLFVQKGAEEFHFLSVAGERPLNSLRNLVWESCPKQRPPRYMVPFLPPYYKEGNTLVPLVVFDRETYLPIEVVDFFSGA